MAPKCHCSWLAFKSVFVALILKVRLSACAVAFGREGVNILWKCKTYFSFLVLFLKFRLFFFVVVARILKMRLITNAPAVLAGKVLIFFACKRSICFEIGAVSENAAEHWWSPRGFS